MSRSVNLVVLIGNLTKDPLMRYTPAGHAVTSFSLATNRSWLSEGKEMEAVDYHNVVTWNKLAETCNNSLSKGRKVYVRGRLSTRSWDGQDGKKQYRTEVVAEEVIFLDPPRERSGEFKETTREEKPEAAKSEDGTENIKEVVEREDVNAEDIPF